MTTEADVLLRLAGELDDLGRRIAVVGAELRTVQAGQAAQPAPVQPPQPQPQPQPQPEWLRYQMPQAPPPPQPWPANPWQPPPPVQRQTLGQKLGTEGAGSRILAWVGGAVTLLGVVLLLVLAVQRGWLGPLPRVLVGAAFGLALVGVAAWLHRKPAARTGAFALAATGIATLYLDAVASTSLFHFLPVIAGLATGLAIAVGGLLVAVRWDSALLATAVVGGCAVCAPMITEAFTPELVTFLLMLQVATAPVQLRRAWPAMPLAAALPPIFASVITTAITGPGGSWANTAAAIGTGATSVALALIVLRRRENDAVALAILATAVVPLLLAAILLPKAQAVPVTGGAAVVLLAMSAGRRWWPGHAGDLAGIVGLVAILQATVTQFDGAARVAVLLGEALALVLAAVWGRNRFALGGALGFAMVGALLGLIFDVSPALLVVARARTSAELAGALVVSLLLLAVSVLLPWGALRLNVFRTPSEDLPPWLVAGISALYGAAGVVLSASLLIVPGRPGFLVGHALITVSWTVVALVLLLHGIKVVASRVIGLVLVGAAVLKLVLFDLAALDGLARVGAFLGAGLVLLVAGTRYARLVASR